MKILKYLINISSKLSLLLLTLLWSGTAPAQSDANHITANSRTSAHNSETASTRIDSLNTASPWTIAGCVYRQDPNVPLESDLQIMASGRAVIIDIELCTNTVLDKLRGLNPNLLIGIYINPMEVFCDALPGIPWKNSIRTELLTNYDSPQSSKSFFVYDSLHVQKIITTQGATPMWLMNLSDDCPAIGNKQYADYFSENVISRLQPFLSKFNFLLFDNALRDIVWLGNPAYTITKDKLAPDINWNSYGDWFEFAVPGSHNTDVDLSWRQGTLKILKNLKAAFSGIKIIANQPNEFYYEACDGKQFENIGSGNVSGPSDWNYGSALRTPNDMLGVIQNYFLPHNLFFNLLQSSQGQGSPAAVDIDETAIVMALLYDSFLFCFEHNSLRVPAIANNLMGKPITVAMGQSGLLIREFEHGYAIFNTSAFPINYLNTEISSYRGKIIMKAPANVVGNLKQLTFSLSQNYPNPFNPSTVIEYSLPKNLHVKLVVCDALGRQVKVLLDEQKAAGKYRVEFDAPHLSSGVYLYQLQTSDFTQTKKLVLVR
jgi:hypothetical protein